MPRPVTDSETAADAAPNTVPFAVGGGPPAVRPVPSEAASLAAIERRLSELVRTVRLGLALGAAWLLWQVFGGGLAWVVTAATWTAGVVVVLLLVVAAAAYFSPAFRRKVGGALRSAALRAAGAGGNTRRG